MDPRQPDTTRVDPKAPTPETLSLRAAAERLGIGQKAARRAAARGELRAIKINGRWRVLAEPLARLLGSEGVM